MDEVDQPLISDVIEVSIHSKYVYDPAPFHKIWCFLFHLILTFF